jgi:hypothetical protein
MLLWIFPNFLAYFSFLIALTSGVTYFLLFYMAWKPVLKAYINDAIDFDIFA